jgi:hypothetical protein
MTTNGDTAAPNGNLLTVGLSLDEARALKAWLLKPSGDGTTAMDDAQVKGALVKLSGAIEQIETIASVRKELEEFGLDTRRLSDQQIVELGRRVSSTPGIAAPSA